MAGVYEKKQNAPVWIPYEFAVSRPIMFRGVERFILSYEDSIPLVSVTYGPANGYDAQRSTER